MRAGACRAPHAPAAAAGRDGPVFARWGRIGARPRSPAGAGRYRAPAVPSCSGPRARRGRAPRDRWGGGARPWRGRWRRPGARGERHKGGWAGRPPRSPPGAAAARPARNKGGPCASFPRPAPAGPPRPRAGIGAGSLRGVSAGAGSGSPSVRPAARFGSAGVRSGSSPGVSFACAFVLPGKGTVCPGGVKCAGGAAAPPNGIALSFKTARQARPPELTSDTDTLPEEAGRCWSRPRGSAQPPVRSDSPLATLSFSDSPAASPLPSARRAFSCDRPRHRFALHGGHSCASSERCREET